MVLLGTTPALAETDMLYGDVNSDGLVDAADALQILQTAVGKGAITDDRIAAGDVSGDFYLKGDYLLDAGDALLILQYAVGKIQSFPVYALDPLAPAMPVPFEGDGVLTPGEEVDFVVEIPTGRDIRILQLSDMQSTLLAEGEACRNKNYTAPYLEDIDGLLWQYVEEAVHEAQPDLIVLAGDNVQGIFDDSGEDWKQMCKHMDSFQIPWMLVFGNHDRESIVGTEFQLQCLLDSEYCLFAKGTVSGQSNYTVAVKQVDEYKYVLWMLDTHGSDAKWVKGNPNAEEIITVKGLQIDQLRWIRDTAAGIEHDLGRSLPSLMFMHIAPKQVATAVKEKYPGDYRQFPFNPWLEGDFGVATESIGGVGSDLLTQVAENIGCVGMFFGHQHKIAFSIVLQNIRMTWGLKTGHYSYHDDGLNGSTLITIDEETNQFHIQYLYSQIFS